MEGLPVSEAPAARFQAVTSRGAADEEVGGGDGG